MRVDLEHDLWHAIALAGHHEPGRFPRNWIDAALADGRIKSRKQAWRTLEKWGDDLYDWGVSVEAGWRYVERHPRLCGPDCL